MVRTKESPVRTSGFWDILGHSASVVRTTEIPVRTTVGSPDHRIPVRTTVTRMCAAARFKEVLT